MGFRLLNIITVQNGKDDSLVVEQLKKAFPFLSVKYFESGFRGIIGQVEEDAYFESYEKDGHILSNDEYDELGEILYYVEDNTLPFSEMFPTRPFVFIEVDCHGGVCSYNGFTARNGQQLFSHSQMNEGHIHLLQSLEPGYNEWHFEPFTREFIKKR